MAVSTYAGTGVPVLLLHGIPGDRHSWDRVAELLATANCPSIIPDLVGFGESTDSLVPLHAKQQADHLVAMLDEMGESYVHLVGFDFGGPTAVHLAALLGSRARSLTLTNTNVFPDTPVPLPLRIASVPYLGDVAFSLFFSRTGLSMIWLAAVRDRRALTFRHFRRTLQSRRTVRTTRLVFLESLRNLHTLYSPIRRLLENSSRPTLVIWSDHDPFFPLEVGRRTAASARGELRILRSCGHFSPLERSQEVADSIFEHRAAVDR